MVAVCAVSKGLGTSESSDAAELHRGEGGGQVQGWREERFLYSKVAVIISSQRLPGLQKHKPCVLHLFFLILRDKKQEEGTRSMLRK